MYKFSIQDANRTDTIEHNFEWVHRLCLSLSSYIQSKRNVTDGSCISYHSESHTYINKYCHCGFGWSDILGSNSVV